MRVKFYGTRGSVPIANPQSVEYGGNTTCIRVFSKHIPQNVAIFCDAGSGFIPASYDLVKEREITDIIILFTHYHHDHTQGLFLAPPIFMKKYKLRLCGPVDHGIGPKEMMQDMMRPPYFPVHVKEIGSHINYKNFEFPHTLVGLIHPQSGYKLMLKDEYERLVEANSFLPIGKGKHPLNECLVITMYRTRHPEQTISYRFEEKSTGRVFVLKTDHENEDGIPVLLRDHLRDVNLLVMDSQYTRAVYEKRTVGFGHGTPDYCVMVAREVGAKELGLTHHDPFSKDDDIQKILKSAQEQPNRDKLVILACKDYMELEV